MKVSALLAVVATGAAFLSPLRPAPARELTLEERVRAQEAIERVYYSHQTGTTRPFDEVVTRSLLESKVRTYLRQTAALQTVWKTPVTADMLRRETERMARQTRMPKRLLEIYAALGDDVLTIQECLARPALVDRLARSFFDHDPSIHGEARRTAEALRTDLTTGRLDPRSERPDRSIIDLVRIDAGKPDRPDRRGDGPHGGSRSPQRLELEPAEFARQAARLPDRPGAIGPVVEEPEAFVMSVVLDKGEGEIRVASFSAPKITWDDWWRSAEGRFDEAAIDPTVASDDPLPMPRSRSSETSMSSPCPDDTWDNGSLDDLPSPRYAHTAVWTGSLMIILGGFNNGFDYTGGRYDPVIDTWSRVSMQGAPSTRGGYTAVWAGSSMVIWGGSHGSGANLTFFDDGGRYDPVTDTWTPTSTIDAPSPRGGHTAVWTGGLMVVWGGHGASSTLDTGGRYDPATDSWTPTSTIGAPSAKDGHNAVWTGSLMIVWGGGQNSGGRYDPASDTWTPMSTTSLSLSEYDQTAIWTGKAMVIWNALEIGGRYDPVSDAWTPVSTTNAPSPRDRQTVVWAGTEMIVWGGSPYAQSYEDTGGRYNPVTDTWTAVPMTGPPSPRAYHTAVWTGNQMIVWGGVGYEGILSTGGRFVPAANVWAPTSTMGAPSARMYHTAVWTGSLMIVWGGLSSNRSVNTGGRYDPATDTWSPTPTFRAPAPRYWHTAVWTGDRMIVWGGSGPNNDGGRYDPVTGTWTPTSLTNTPSPRYGHTAVWAGTQMIVWGGQYTGLLNTGGRYDPSADSWTPTSTANAPAPRSRHTVVWTDALMLVWGGSTSVSGDALSNTGGRYDPAGDSWTSIATINAPSPRADHTAVWAKDRMVVWGGDIGYPNYANTGGRYDLQSDTWDTTSTIGAPSPRVGHSSIWTGDRMVVWGGSDSSGGRYDPVSDTWTPTTLTDAPSPRGGHTAVWTGDLMMVWGGGNGSFKLSTGGRYCTCIPTTYYRDADGDGFGSGDVPVESCTQPSGYVADGSDCDDGSASLWRTPGEVRDLLFADDQTLVWTAPAEGGATSLVYDLLLSNDPTDFVTSATCVASDAAATTAIDPLSPVPGAAFFYLARAQNACPKGDGSLGTRSDGTGRIGRTCP